MKRWRRFFLGCIPAVCYGLAVGIWMLFGTGWLVLDGFARRDGRMSPRELSLADCELVSMVQQNEKDCLATDADPQLIWINADERVVRSLTLDVTHGGEPGEMALYFIGTDGEAFGREKRVFPREVEPGRFVFYLPAAKVHALRLDPCSSAQLLSDVSLELNTECPLWLYYQPSWMQLAGLLLLPGLAASGISTIDQAREGWSAWRRKRQGPA